jgi:hypothetical protein
MICTEGKPVPAENRILPKTTRQPDCRCYMAQSIELFVQLFEQRLGVSLDRVLEALGEPAIDLAEHRARFVATILQCEAHYRQCQGFGALSTCNLSRSVKAGLSLCKVRRIALQQELTL